MSISRHRPHLYILSLILLLQFSGNMDKLLLVNGAVINNGDSFYADTLDRDINYYDSVADLGNYDPSDYDVPGMGNTGMRMGLQARDLDYDPQDQKHVDTDTDKWAQTQMADSYQIVADDSQIGVSSGRYFDLDKTRLQRNTKNGAPSMLPSGRREITEADQRGQSVQTCKPKTPEQQSRIDAAVKDTHDSIEHITALMKRIREHAETIVKEVNELEADFLGSRQNDSDNKAYAKTNTTKNKNCRINTNRNNGFRDDGNWQNSGNSKNNFNNNMNTQANNNYENGNMNVFTIEQQQQRMQRLKELQQQIEQHRQLQQQLQLQQQQEMQQQLQQQQQSQRQQQQQQQPQQQQQTQQQQQHQQQLQRQQQNGNNNNNNRVGNAPPMLQRVIFNEYAAPIKTDMIDMPAGDFMEQAQYAVRSWKKQIEECKHLLDEAMLQAAQQRASGDHNHNNNQDGVQYVKVIKNPEEAAAVRDTDAAPPAAASLTPTRNVPSNANPDNSNNENNRPNPASQDKAKIVTVTINSSDKLKEKSDKQQLTGQSEKTRAELNEDVHGDQSNDKDNGNDKSTNKRAEASKQKREWKQEPFINGLHGIGF